MGDKLMSFFVYYSDDFFGYKEQSNENICLFSGSGTARKEVSCSTRQEVTSFFERILFQRLFVYE